MLSISLSFFFSKEYCQELCGRHQINFCLHKSTKNANAHYFYPARKLVCLNSSVQSYCFSMKDSGTVAVLLYNSSVTFVLHPVGHGAPQSHEAMYHKPPVISGYGNISQTLHRDYKFIKSQPGNFSLNGSLKLVNARKSAVKQQTVYIHPTSSKHTDRSRVL